MVEIAVAVLMLAAMIDMSRAASWLAPVLWAALLLTGALALASTARRTSRPVGADRGAPAIVHGPIHGALGCVVMAALVMVMVAPATTSGAAGHHGASASVLTMLIGAGTLAYAVYSVAVLRHGAVRERIQFVAMGASTLAMAAAVIV